MELGGWVRRYEKGQIILEIQTNLTELGGISRKSSFKTVV